MRLPTSHISAGPANSTDTSALHNDGIRMFSKKGGYDENWSSLIGIITAIVGNVLISFALNMQRYAHIRLDREWQEKERQRKKRSASGTSLSRLADEERSQDDGKKTFHLPRNSGHGNAQQSDSVEANESDPLIPQSPSRSPDRPSFQSEDSDSYGQEAYKQKSYLKSPYWWAGIILMTVGEAGNFLAYGFAPASIVSPLGVVALISNCIIAPFMLKEPFRKRDVLGVVIAVGGAVTVALSANDNNPKLGPGEIWKLISTWEFETYLGVTVGVIALLMVASNRYGEKNILIDLGLVGLLGGYTALSTKGVASLLSYTLWRVITFPVFYLLVAILIGTAVMQIKYVNRALQRFDATQVIPVQFVLFTLSVILGSAVLYRDFERTSGDDAGKFVGGCAMTFLGVWFITTGRPRRQDGDEGPGPEPEDAITLVGESYRDSIDESHPNEARTRRSSTTRTSSPSTPSMNIMSETSSRAQQDFFPRPDVFSNPWALDKNIPRPAQFERHTSTPILPSEAAPPPGTMTSASDPDLPPPRTPTRGKSHMEYPTTPTTTPQPRRQRTNERISRAASGPLLASPLSTTLSAMVQDLKRTTSTRHDTRRGTVLGIEAELGAPPPALDRRRTNELGGMSGGERGRTGSRTLAGLSHGYADSEQGVGTREGV